MSRFFTILLVVFVASSGVPQQNAPSLDSALQHVRDRNLNATLSELDRLEAEDPAAFVKADIDYLVGRLAYEAGHKALAVKSFQSVLNRNSKLSPYALKHLSQIARSTGNLTLERLYLSEMAILRPESLPAKGARLRSVRNRLEAGDSNEAIRMLAADDGSPAGNVDSREVRALLAEAMLAAGDSGKAKEVFLSLLNERTDRPDDHSLTAVRALDRPNSTEENSELTQDERYLRSNVLYFHREFTEARKHLDAMISATPDGPRAAENIFRIGTSYTQEGNFAEGLKWFERVTERFADSPWAADSLLHAASAYSRVGKPREAVTRYELFIKKYPHDPRLDRAYLNIVDLLRDQGEDTDALRWCVRTSEVFRGRNSEAVAIFAEVRIHMARNDWTAALQALDKLGHMKDLGGAAVPGGTSRNEVAFLRAYSLEQLNRYWEAIDGYLSVPDGRDEYYGWRATERLRALSDHTAAKSYIDQKVGRLFSAIANDVGETKERAARSAIRLVSLPDLRQKALDALTDVSKRSSIPSFSKEESVRNAGTDNEISRILIRLGLFDEAAPEIASVNKNKDNLQFFARGGYANKVLQHTEPAWKKVPADLPLEMLPRDELELLYPAPYAAELIRYSSARNVDPRFVLAIMRQESRFDTNAASSAAARGLMQFISPTASKTAGQLGIDSFDQENLFAPSTAILFGSQYLSELFKKFPEQPDAVAAAYNGGEDNMARWLARSRSGLPERYVPEILYSQSKDYVTRVMSNFRVYCYLYDDLLRPHR